MYDLSMPNSKPGQCCKCRGTGQYSWGGTVNGKPKNTGECYSCRGTGKQSVKQIRRNETYNRHKLATMFGGDSLPPEDNDIDSYDRKNACKCGSGLPRYAVNDARGIFVTYACDKCKSEKTKGYRKEIFTNPHYWHNEPID